MKAHRATWLGLAPGLLLMVVGAMSVARAANPTGSCKGEWRERQDGMPEAPNWTKLSHTCRPKSTCPALTNYTASCQEIMVTLFQDGSARFTCGCKYTWAGEGEPPGGNFVLVQTGTGCDSWVDRAAGGAFQNAFCQGDCPGVKVCAEDKEAQPEDNAPNGTTRTIKCECKDP